MLEINWWASSRLWLSLEDYTNAGLSQDEMQKCIEAINSDHAGSVMNVVQMGVNSNLIVETHYTRQRDQQFLIDIIEFRLTALLEVKRSNELTRL
jgi:hypothetical protein